MTFRDQWFQEHNVTRRAYTGVYVHFFEIKSHWVKSFSLSLSANGVQGTVGGAWEKEGGGLEKL